MDSSWGAGRVTGIGEIPWLCRGIGIPTGSLFPIRFGSGKKCSPRWGMERFSPDGGGFEEPFPTGKFPAALVVEADITWLRQLGTSTHKWCQPSKKFVIWILKTLLG
jgi:hypothetical protein